RAQVHAPGGRVTVTTQRAGDAAVLRVTDSGQGIRTELLGRVFDLFVQEPQMLERSRGGLGLGLALVKRLRPRHPGRGGRCGAAWTAGPGRGGEFRIRVAVSVGPDATPGASAGARGGAASRRVLVVEDSPDARDTMRLLLELAGHDVDTAEDGPSGLARLRAF